MILRTQNASGGLKIDIGGPCPKPYINITFWGIFQPRKRKNQFWNEKVRFGRKFRGFCCFGAIRVILGGSETLIFL